MNPSLSSEIRTELPGAEREGNPRWKHSGGLGRWKDGRRQRKPLFLKNSDEKPFKRSAGLGHKGDVCVLESLCPYPFSVQAGENTGKSRMELTWSFLSKSNLRLDSHGTVPGLGNSRDLGNRRRGFGAMSDGEPTLGNSIVWGAADQGQYYLEARRHRI